VVKKCKYIYPTNLGLIQSVIWFGRKIYLDMFAKTLADQKYAMDNFTFDQSIVHCESFGITTVF